jgi:hypothetical protein
MGKVVKSEKKILSTSPKKLYSENIFDYRTRFDDIPRQWFKKSSSQCDNIPCIQRQTGFGSAQHSMRPWPKS